MTDTTTARSTVNTVLGPVPADDLGVVAVHEALLSVVPGAEHAYDITLDRAEIFEVLARKLTDFRDHGGTTIVDSTGMFHGRDVNLYEALSKATGVHIVAFDGYGSRGDARRLLPHAADQPADAVAGREVRRPVLPGGRRGHRDHHGHPRGHDPHRREPVPGGGAHRTDHRRSSVDLALTTPPQRRPSPMWDGCIEAGDIARIVASDYAHVIGDLRGSGDSGGEHIGNYDAGGVCLGQDAYDVIEWVAAQPWCDGNVGMIGISYFGSMQVLAAPPPPSLKAIVVSGGHYDFYETTYHGGIMWFMPRAAREGRGGDSGWAFTDRVRSRMLETYSPEEIEERVAKRLQDPDVAAWPRTWSTS